MKNTMTRDEMLSCYSDYYKEANGFRPTDWERISAKTDAELQADLDYYVGLTEEEYKRELENEAAQLVKWEQRMDELMRMGARDLATAIRWDMEANDYGQDVSYYCFCVGISYDQETNIRVALKMKEAVEAHDKE